MDPDRTYSEQLTKRILARAVELDHIRSANYSLIELRSIASEVGVSDTALAQAMRELEPASDSSPRALTSRALRAGRATPAIGAMMMAAAGVIGLAGGIVDNATHFITSPLAMPVVLMFGGAFAVLESYDRPLRGFMRFALANTALWATYGVTWIVAGNFFPGPGRTADLVFMVVVPLGWSLSTMFGAGIAALHQWHRRSGSGDRTTETTPPLKQRIATKLKSWIDIWASRSIGNHNDDQGARAPLYN